MSYKLLAFLFLISLSLRADVKSLDGTIRFDSNSDTQSEMILNSTGLGIGGQPSSNLHVIGNAIVEQLSINTNSSDSNLHINGTMSQSVATITGNATLSAEHSIILLDLVSASSNIDLVLPSATESIGKILTIKVISGNVNAILRDGEGIDQYFKVTLGPLGSNSYSSQIQLFSSGSRWYIFSNFLTGNSNDAVSISDNLIAHWPLDEGQGDIAYDASGSGHHATFQGTGNITWTQGQIRGAIHLDGTDDNLFAGDQINLSDTSFSISFWDYRLSNTSDDYFFSQGHGATNKGLTVGYRASDVNTFAFWGNDLNSGNTFTSAEWRHWVYSYDRDGSVREIYLNGQLEAADTPGSAYAPDGKSLYLGVSPNNNSFFHGYVDDIRVYNKALNSYEVEELYYTRNFDLSPVLLSAVASDPNNTSGVSANDQLTLAFSEGTNQPDVSTKSAIDTLIDWKGKSLGQGYTGTWSSNQALVITINDATGADISIGDEIEIKVNTSFYQADDSSKKVHGKIAITGLWEWFDFSNGLVAYYSFEHPIDDYVYDQAGNTSLLLSSSNSQFSTEGRLGSALTFNGNLTAFGTGLDLSGQSYTITYWDKRGDSGRQQHHVALGSSSSNGKASSTGYYSGDQFLMEIYGATHSSGNTYPTSIWRHWAFSYNSDTDGMLAYLNGNLIRGDTSTGYGYSGSDSVRLGADEAGSNFFKGELDEVRIYNRVLSQAEIQQLSLQTTFSSQTTRLSLAIASDEDFGDTVLSVNDNLILHFSYPTNTPTAGTKSEIDNIVDFEGYSLGIDYMGTWTSNVTLEITVTNATSANLPIGANINILASANLKNAEETLSATIGNNVTLTGAWGEVASANLVAYYPLDQTTGLIATDTENGKNGNLDAGMDDSDWVSGRIGNALNLDGVDDNFIIGSGNFSFSGNSFSIAFWSKRASTGSNHWLFGMGTGSTNNGLYIGYRNTDKFAFAFYGNDLNTTATFTDLGWNHWTCTYDITTTTQSIYLNGSLFGTRTAAAFTGTGDLLIGSALNDATHFHGIVDEIRIYDKALDANEVLSIYSVE